MNGKKLTKVLAVLVCAVMLMQCTAIGVLAADIDPEAVVYTRPEVLEAIASQIGNNYVYVDVITTENCENDETVMAYLVDGSKNLITVGYSGVGSARAEVKLGVPDSVETGNYKIYVALNGAKDVFESEVYYIGVGDVTGFFEAVNMVDVEVAAVREKLDETYAAFSVIECTEDEEGNVILKLTGEDYEALTDKDAFAELILNGVNGKYSDNKGNYDAENSEDFIKEAYIVATYNSCEKNKVEAIAPVLYRFASVIGFDAEDEELYGAINNKSTFAKVAKTMAKTVENVDELATVLEQAAAVQIVNETHWANLVSVVKANNDLFDVSEKQIKKLEGSKKLRNYFCEEFKGTYFSVEDVQEAWEDAYEYAEDKIDSGSSGGSGAPGGPSGPKVPVIKTDTVSTQLTDSQNNFDANTAVAKIYTDMQGYQWASEAVLNLTNKGVVSGYGDNTFAPGNSLTRAEFTKMIVNVFGLADLTAKSSFADVDENAWYYIYIASAEKVGLANGYGNGLFGVNDAITRQDAITLIYRAAQIKGLSLEKFTASVDRLVDKGEIAPYAVDAVKSLYNAGVYLGTSEPERVDVFKPAENATRAYVAVVLNQVYMYMN